MTLPEFALDVDAIRAITAVTVILSMFMHVTGMSFAACARVTYSHWVACAVDDSINFGLKPGGELVLESTICHEIRQHQQPVVFGHASADPHFATHHTPLTYGLESYISIPIVQADGRFFGTLCAIDSVPADLTDPAIVKTLTLFAQLIAMSLDTQGHLDSVRAELTDANENGRLREHFMAVLGHDPRTPVSAVRLSADLPGTKTEDTRPPGVVAALRLSSRPRGALLGDVLGFAPGRMGGGIPVKCQANDDLPDILKATVDEIRASHPQATFNEAIDLNGIVYCDPLRISQLLSNLLGNAVTHGSLTSPIDLHIWQESDQVVISVMNRGAPISPRLMPLLFEPFTRSEAGGRGEGLGLGLYIASQIASAHHGTLTVSSSAQLGTCFIARFPCAQSA